MVVVVGVNGSGKTTTIAKLGALLERSGRSALLGAGDTFRAAAAEQLATWADRLGLDVVSGHAGADPASVAFDALAAARARGKDVVIVDTAGRLHSKHNLMEELGKVVRVLQREAGEVDEVLLVLDGTSGQNALAQARVFTEVVGVTGPGDHQTRRHRPGRVRRCRGARIGHPGQVPGSWGRRRRSASLRCPGISSTLLLGG